MTDRGCPAGDKFMRRLRRLHIIKLTFDVSAGALKALWVFALLSAVFSLVDLVFPLDFPARKMILVSSALFAVFQGGKSVFFVWKEGIRGLCVRIGRDVLTACELCLCRKKLVSIGISGELIDEEVKKGLGVLEKFRPGNFFKIDIRQILIFTFSLFVLFLNRPSALRIIFPGQKNIADFMKVEMKKFAVKGEKWSASVYPAEGVIPEIFMRFADDSWAERNLEKKPGHFHFEIAECMRPFSVRFKWKDLKTPDCNIRFLERPEVVSRTLTLNFPEYLKLEKQETSYGGISAFKGTRVDVKIVSGEKLKSGKIVVVSGSAVKKNNLKISGEKGAGSFMVEGGGSWYVELVSGDGLESTGPVHWPVEITEDMEPQASIVSPQTDLVVSDRFSEVPILWRASDDFGVTRVFLIFRKNAGEQKKTELYSGYSKEEKGNYPFKISGLLNPGDFLEIWAEAEDRSGNKGESGHFSVELKDFLFSRREGLNKERAIKEEIFRQYMSQSKLNSGRKDWTCGELIKKQNGIEKELSKLSDLTSSLISEMRLDPLYGSFYVSEYEGIRDSLDNMARLSRQATGAFGKNDLENAFARQDEIQQGLERMALLSEEIFKRSTMDNLNNLSTESTDLADKIDDFLRNSQDAEKMGELLQITKRIGDIMKELAATVKDMPNDLPEEFVNSDSIKSLDFNDAVSALKDMKDALSSGNIQDALNKAKNLLKQLRRMQEFIKQASGDVPPMSSGFEKKDETLGEIIEEEEKIYSGTKAVVSSREERAAKAARKKYAVLKQKAEEIRQSAQSIWQNRTGKFRDDLNRISAKLYDFYKETQTGTDRFAKEQLDFETPLKSAGKQLEEMKKVSVSSGTVSMIDDLAKQFGDFFEIYSDTSGAGVSAGESEFLLEISTQQVKTAAKTDEFAEKLYEWARGSAQFPGEIISDIKNARRQMEKSHEFLLSLDPGLAAAAQEKALYFLKKSAGQLSSYEQVPQSPSGSSSIPSALPSMKQGGGSGGSIGFNEQSFEIPESRQSFFDGLLEELNKAKKTPKPEKYRELLEDYYDQLSK
ncbi:MAG: DUF4175 family protein [bacterium]